MRRSAFCVMMRFIRREAKKLFRERKKNAEIEAEVSRLEDEARAA